jgi:hypothetical protein
MERLLMLSAICVVVLLFGWLYAGFMQLLKRERNKPEDETVKDTLPWPAHRP